jgi:hypothetical protein
MSGNAVFVRIIDELLPTTSLLLALSEPGGPRACSAHRHETVLAAFGRSGAAAAAGMRRHLLEIERLSSAREPAAGPPLRDLFAPHRDGGAWKSPRRRCLEIPATAVPGVDRDRGS